EQLECRLAPATSLYVVSQDVVPGVFGTSSTLKEYSTTGSLIRSVAVIPGNVPGEQAHDLAVTAGHAYVYNGTSAVYLANYDGTTGNWTGVGQGGTSTDPNRVGSGGACILGRSAFLSDMNTPGGPEHGIVWIQLDTGALFRFATDTEPI